MRSTIEMAREVGFHVGDQFVAGASEAELERLVELVRADEREACAVDADWCIQNHLEHLIPERIRARSST
jgi:hypothetical protein